GRLSRVRDALQVTDDSLCIQRCSVAELDTVAQFECPLREVGVVRQRLRQLRLVLSALRVVPHQHTVDRRHRDAAGRDGSVCLCRVQTLRERVEADVQRATGDGIRRTIADIDQSRFPCLPAAGLVTARVTATSDGSRRDEERTRQCRHDPSGTSISHGCWSFLSSVLATGTVSGGSNVVERTDSPPASPGSMWWHATYWPPPMWRSSGSWCAHNSVANGQRVRNRHPDGGDTGDGSSPSTRTSPVDTASSYAPGTEPSSNRV